MKFSITRHLWLAIALASSALSQVPIEPPPAVPIHPTPIEPAIEGEEEGDEDDATTVEGVVPPPSVVLGEVPATATRVIEFQADEIGLVFRTLARQARMNVVVSEKTSRAGTVTLRLDERTPREAIEVIVQDKGLVMEEINGVYFIKTVAELANEPTAKKLERLTTSVIAPLGKLKGEYYRQLVQSGVPEATAASVILGEEISKSAFDSSVRGTSSNHQLDTDPKDWIAWSVIGATGLEFMQRMPLIVLHLILTVAVWATARRTHRTGIVLTFLSPFFWGVATLIGGVLVAGLYWIIHHSSLRMTSETVC